MAAAVDAFGRLDVLVNNAGILRDRMLVSMSEEEWDDVIDVHLKGHFVPTRFAAAHWREQVKAGRDRAGVDHPHVVDLGAARQPGPDQLRRRQGRHRLVQHHLRAGAGALRRALELHRPGRPHPAHRGHARARRRRRRARPTASTCGTRPTCRRSSPTSPPPTATITGRTFFVQGGTVRVMEPWRMGERARARRRGGRSPSSERRFPASSADLRTTCWGNRAPVLCTISAEVVPGSLGRRAGRGVPQPPR